MAFSLIKARTRIFKKQNIIYVGKSSISNNIQFKERCISEQRIRKSYFPKFCWNRTLNLNSLVLKGFHMSWAQTTEFSHEDRG